MPDDEKKPKHSWLAPAAKFVGIAIATAVVSLGSSWGFTKNVKGEAEAAATKSASEAATEKTKEANRAEAMYLGALAERIEGAFDEVDDDLGELEKDLDACDDRAREALMTANVALRMMEARYGTRSVERTYGRVESEAPAPPPSPKPRARQKMKLPTYQLAED